MEKKTGPSIPDTLRFFVEVTSNYFKEKINFLWNLYPRLRLDLSAALNSGKYFDQVNRNPNHNERHVRDVVTLVKAFAMEEKLSLYDSIKLEITAYCHDLGHTGRKDVNYEFTVRKYIASQAELGRTISLVEAIGELKKYQKMDVLAFQDNETKNITTAVTIFVKFTKELPSLKKLTTRYPEIIDEVIGLISASYHPRWYDPKTQDFWRATGIAKIFRDADALPCFVWFKYNELNRAVTFNKILEKEKGFMTYKKSEGSGYYEVDVSSREDSWFQQVIGVYLEEKNAGNVPLYQKFFRGEAESLEEYFERLIVDKELSKLTEGKFPTGKELLLDVVQYERGYINVLSNGIVPLYTNAGKKFFEDVKGSILQDLNEIEEYLLSEKYSS